MATWNEKTLEAACAYLNISPTATSSNSSNFSSSGSQEGILGAGTVDMIVNPVVDTIINIDSLIVDSDITNLTYEIYEDTAATGGTAIENLLNIDRVVGDTDLTININPTVSNVGTKIFSGNSFGVANSSRINIIKDITLNKYLSLAPTKKYLFRFTNNMVGAGKLYFTLSGFLQGVS